MHYSGLSLQLTSVLDWMRLFCKTMHPTVLLHFIKTALRHSVPAALYKLMKMSGYRMMDPAPMSSMTLEILIKCGLAPQIFWV